MTTVLLERLGVTGGWGDLDWCTQAEVWGWFWEAQSRLAELGLFVAAETFSTVAGTGSYALPADWLNTIFASVNGQQMRPVSAAELVALDSYWSGAACWTQQVPGRYSMDAGALGTITLYPYPGAVNSVTLVDQVLPPAISTGQTTSPIHALLQDYFLYFALQRARGKESPNAMPEVAAAAAQMVKMYEQIICSYWGQP
jgi:hypothetical protein